MIRMLRTVALVALAAWSTASGAALAVDFKIVAPLRGLCRPDLPPCTTYNLFGPPVMSGDFVVWTNRAGPADGIWSYQISNKKIRKLAGLETKAPGGKGKFTAFGNANSEYPTTIGGETVVFFARDKDGVIGVYATSVRGGGIALIADARTAIPKGGGRLFKELRFASTNGKTVAFVGYDANGATGIFRANVDGSKLETVIDATKTQLDARTPTGTNPGYYGIYGRPTVGAKFVQFYASGLFDPVNGANATFRAAGGFEDLVDHLTSLEGGTDGQHVRTGIVSAAEGSNEIVVQADEPNTGYAGLFKTKTVDFATAFVTTKDKVPGVRSTFNTIYGFGFDVSGLAFTAFYVDQGGSNHYDVFFVAKPGGPISRVAKGTDYYLPYVGDRSVSGGRIAFTEGTNYADTFFIATPK